MLNQLKIDDLLDKVDSRYGLVLVAARRARAEHRAVAAPPRLPWD